MQGLGEVGVELEQLAQEALRNLARAEIELVDGAEERQQIETSFFELMLQVGRNGVAEATHLTPANIERMRSW